MTPTNSPPNGSDSLENCKSSLTIGGEDGASLWQRYDALPAAKGTIVDLGRPNRIIYNFQPHPLTVRTNFKARWHADVAITDRYAGWIDTERAILLPYSAIIEQHSSSATERARCTPNIIWRRLRLERWRWHNWNGTRVPIPKIAGYDDDNGTRNNRFHTSERSALRCGARALSCPQRILQIAASKIRERLIGGILS